MFDKILFFKGKLGHEQFICEQLVGDILPQRKDLIAIERDDVDDIYASDVYVVKQVLINYACHEYNIFIEPYNWED